MTELTYEVPTVGEKHQASDARVSTALTEIKSVLNGRLTGSNFASETITPKKFKKSSAWKNEGAIGELRETEKFERETIQPVNVQLYASINGETIGGTTLVVRVGEVVIATSNSGSKGIGHVFSSIGPFRVQAAEKWSIEVTAGRIFEGEFSYQAGIV